MTGASQNAMHLPEQDVLYGSATDRTAFTTVRTASSLLWIRSNQDPLRCACNGERYSNPCKTKTNPKKGAKRKSLQNVRSDKNKFLNAGTSERTSGVMFFALFHFIFGCNKIVIRYVPSIRKRCRPLPPCSAWFPCRRLRSARIEGCRDMAAR